MILKMIIPILVLSIVLPIGGFYLSKKNRNCFNTSFAVNLLTFFGVLLFTTVFLFSSGVSAAETSTAAASVSNDSAGMAYLAAALAVGLGSIGCGIGVGAAASAAIGAISENENILGKTLIFVGLAEGISIFGLLISLIIIFRV